MGLACSELEHCGQSFKSQDTELVKVMGGGLWIVDILQEFPVSPCVFTEKQC